MVEALSRATANSPFLAGLIAKHPNLVAQFEAGDFETALQLALAAHVPGNVGATLRQQKQGVALVTAIADLSGTWDLTRITHVLSDFADAALEIAIATAIAERMPETEPRGFAVIALGKHGGRELNYSSDIDPIFLFDPMTLPHREREDVTEAAARYGRRVIELMSAIDANGYVFRVDMRLRPSPEISPLVLPIEGAIGYYESSALAWEQAAFIRSRFSAGDLNLGQYFLKNIQPFIWRKSLDFGQIRNIGSMTAQIRDHYHEGQILGPGYDLKRGMGGIRECEFFAQAHQLIHGGRDPSLRSADTREALIALAQAGHIEAETAQLLCKSYEVLRTIEHRLQMQNDRQTHSIPENTQEADAVARLQGVANSEALIALLQPVTLRVAETYDKIMSTENGDGNRLAAGGLPLEEQLSDMGFDDIAQVMQRIRRWRSGQLRAIRSDAAIDAFEEVLPAILQMLAAAPDPGHSLARLDNMLETLPSAINIFRLLDARPALLQLLGDILSYAPTLAEALGQHGNYLDALIHVSAMELPGDAKHLTALLAAKCDGAVYEQKLDIVRAWVGEMRFNLGVQLIEGRHDPLEIAVGYAHLAEAAIRILVDATIVEFETAHGKIVGGELLILALGRLGGEALTHASDLDLVLLFTGDIHSESDGRRPLGATLYFNRLAQRVISALSAPTALGSLYEVDTRLRPSGGDGPLCCSVDSFTNYQMDEAWTWEHMALTRARPVYGSPEARLELSQVIQSVLCKSRDKVNLYKDVISMRAEMRTEKSPKGQLDFKLLPGGLVDAEFIVHAMQLESHIGLSPQLPKAISQLQNAGRLPKKFGVATDFLTQLLVILRLVSPDCHIPPEPAKILISRLLGFECWSVVLQASDTARSHISDQWQALFGTKNS